MTGDKEGNPIRLTPEEVRAKGGNFVKSTGQDLTEQDRKELSWSPRPLSKEPWQETTSAITELHADETNSYRYGSGKSALEEMGDAEHTWLSRHVKPSSEGSTDLNK